MQSAEFAASPRRIGVALGAALLMTVSGCTGDDEKPFAGELPPPGAIWPTLEPPQPDVAGDGDVQQEPGAVGEQDQDGAAQDGTGQAGNDGSGGIGSAAGGTGQRGSGSNG